MVRLKTKIIHTFYYLENKYFRNGKSYLNATNVGCYYVSVMADGWNTYNIEITKELYSSPLQLWFLFSVLFEFPFFGIL